MSDVPMSQVSMTISAEEYIVSETAKVSVTATYAMMDQSSDSRAEVMKAAMDVSTGDWFVSGVNRAEDNSGIETVTYNLTVRVPEKEINALKAKIKTVNRVGLKMNIVGTDYSPTAAQLEEGKKATRKKIYAKINDELQVLRSDVADSEEIWTVGEINFLTSQPALTKNSGLRASAMMYESFGNADDEEESSGVTQKLTLSANVVFARKVYSRL